MKASIGSGSEVMMESERLVRPTPPVEVHMTRAGLAGLWKPVLKSVCKRRIVRRVEPR